MSKFSNSNKLKSFKSPSYLFLSSSMTQTWARSNYIGLIECLKKRRHCWVWTKPISNVNHSLFLWTQPGYSLILNYVSPFMFVCTTCLQCCWAVHAIHLDHFKLITFFLYNRYSHKKSLIRRGSLLTCYQSHDAQEDNINKTLSCTTTFHL